MTRTDTPIGKKILLDGGMGQELIHRSRKTATPLWSTQVLIDEPDVVTQLHLDYINSGADIITLASYSATPERLARENLEHRIEEIQHQAAQCAHDARAQTDSDRDIRIAGCLPPLVASYRPELLPEKQIALQAYRQLVNLQNDGVDLFICETMGSIDEAMYAASAALDSGKPVWVALTASDETRSQSLRSGEPVKDAIEQLCTLPIEAVLLNCSWPESISHCLPTIITALEKAGSHIKVGAYANGFTSIDALKPGGTVSSLEARHDLGPEEYAAHANTWLTQGASIIGGCCEVGPAHIERLKQLLNQQ